MTQKLKVIQGGKTNPFASWKDLLVLQEALRNAGHEAARVAVARGEGKKLKDKGGLDKPLTQDEIDAWSTEMERDGNKHFVLLLKQCTPQLVVLDIDDPESAHGKRLVETCQGASLMQARSRSRGHHFYLVRDSGARDIFPNNAFMTPLKGNRSDATQVGEALSYQATAYVPEGGEIQKLCDVQGLYQLLTGSSVSPQDKLAGMKQDISEKMSKWTEGMRDCSMFKLVMSMPRRLREHGLEDRQAEVAAFMAECWTRVDPDDKQKYNTSQILVKMEEASEELEADIQYTDGTAGPHSVAYNLVRASHKGHIVVDSSKDKDQTVHAWDPFRNRWATCQHVSGDQAEPMVAEIKANVISALYDATGKPPTTGQVQAGKKIVWNELVDNYSVSQVKQYFDYPGNDQVIYLGLGDGKQVARISAVKGDKPVDIIPNEPGFKVSLYMTAPAEEESAFFKDYINQMWPEEGVASWHVQVWGEALCPAQVRRPHFVSWVGGGGHGRSTLIDALIHALGGYAAKVKPEVLTKPAFGTPEIRQLGGRAEMIGKRLVFVDESLKGVTLDEGFIKAAVAGGELSTGGMRKDDQMYRLDGKLFVAPNASLRLLDAGNTASMRRMYEVPFSKTVDDGEQKHGNTDMPRLLEAEAAGIVRLLLNAAEARIKRYHETNDPIEVPVAIRTATRAWFGQQNYIQNQLKSFFNATTGRVPEVIKGRKAAGQERYTGIVAMAALLVEGEDSAKNAVREANTFLSTLAHARDPGRATYNLEVTDECIKWLADLELDATLIRQAFWSLFKKPDQAKLCYEQRLDEALREASVKSRDEGPVFDQGGDFADL